MPTETEYYIVRGMKLVPGKTMMLFKLDECTDCVTRSEAIQVLKNRGLNDKQIESYLDDLEYMQTRGG